MNKQLLWLLIAVVAIGGCRGARDEKATKPITALPPGSFAKQWSAKLDLRGDPVRDIHLVGDRVFAYTGGNFSYVLTRPGGALQFINNVDVSGGVLRAPIILGDYLVYPTSSSLEVYSNRGRILKNILLESPSGASGAGLGNMVYIGINPRGGYGRVVAIDITRPSNVARWSVLTRGNITGRPAIHNKIVYVASDDGAIVALSADDATPIWSTLPGHIFTTNGQFQTDLHADETGVYASNTDSKVYALDLETGRIKWQYYSMTQLKTAPAVTGTMVYQWVPRRGMAGIDKNDGGYNREPKWIVPNAEQFLSEDETNAYLRRRDNTILAVDKQTGKVAFRSRTKKYNIFATNITDSTIFVGTREGEITAIRPILAAGEMGELVMRLDEVKRVASAR